MSRTCSRCGQVPVPSQPPRLGEQPTLNVIWNADFIIDTSMIRRAAKSRDFYGRLAFSSRRRRRGGTSVGRSFLARVRRLHTTFV